MKRFRRVLGTQACRLAVLSIFGWLASAGHTAGQGGMLASVEVSWLPKEPKQGEVLHLWVSAAEGVYVERGEMLSRPLRFYTPPDRPGRWDALFGIDARQEPGEYTVRIWLASAAGGTDARNRTASIRVLPGDFEEERLTVADSQVHLSKKDLARVKREEAQISSLWSVDTKERLWEGSFLTPVEGMPGSVFGLRRWMNDEPRSFHTGMDIKAPELAPVQAANHGRVVLEGDFFFGGRSVFLDHGQGVFTMYFHLSKINVVQGQRVAKGDVVGLVGMTGRATGPHLHWGVRMDGARVDPASLVDRTRQDQ